MPHPVHMAVVLTLPWHSCPWNAHGTLLSCEQCGACKEERRKSTPGAIVPLVGMERRIADIGHTDPSRGIFIPC